MAYRILVPLDGTEIGKGVIPYLRHVVARPDAVVTLLHVLPDLTEYAQSHIDTEHGRAASHMRDFISILELDPDRVYCEFRMGDPAEEILKYAVLNAAALIIMPTHGRTGFNRLLSGSVTEQVLRRSHCPLLLSHDCGDRPPPADGKALFERILVPLDGTSQGFSILPVVEDFARLFQSEVILFHDNSDLSKTGGSRAGDNTTLHIEAQHARLVDEGIKVSMQYTDAGHTVKDILKAVSTSQADLIAMTTHGRKGIDRIAFGSIVEYLLRHATRPMLTLSTTPGPAVGHGDK
ncbi:MAG: universal stress protein [Gammaproteobacteria bacterium]|nr:universal stress protein [Gammaproteobacteria bacterium]